MSNSFYADARSACSQLPLWGDWELSYADRTHLPKDEYMPLGRFSLKGNAEDARRNSLLPFRFWPIGEEQLRHLFEGLTNPNYAEQQQKAAARGIRGALAESIMRTGMVPPVMPKIDMERLDAAPYFTAVTDTNALKRGTMSYLHFCFEGRKTIWTTVPAMCMVEIQGRAEFLDGLPINTPGAKHADVVRIRSTVTCSAWEIRRLQTKHPVDYLFLEPTLLRKISEPKAESEGAGLKKDSIQDRIILESLKTMKRERGLDRNLFLVTGDKNMVTFAEAENIPALYSDIPKLTDEVYSVRYDIYRQSLVACPVQMFLWDLAAVFGRVRLERADKTSCVEINYYHAQMRDYINERLHVTCHGPDFTTTPT